MEKNEYKGAALNSFILALGHSKSVISKLLADAGVDKIEPERWYDYDWARGLYYKIEAEVGPSAVIAVGRKMIETADYPPDIDGIQTLLMALGHAYRLNARGPDVGEITCELEDEHSATLVFTPKFPCALNIGIVEGSCSRYGEQALIEHGPNGCLDRGDPACTYHVSW
ncbi:hypothetical protein ENSA5_23630 [Enhygromyxa salina]|uniref:4-vinyl reductase 4VR domain-containing protein n=1 Tax=Enhygromyxa salina TaxID=215803 RepID=A0A2S9YBF4_9BACT|nr:hypothetical protein [Enhygromyxa salina]PRQ02435.1 hypothetical protein ENSA5_23630 [Enhygromyxa salina]